jgi:hypothetical protein
MNFNYNVRLFYMISLGQHKSDNNNRMIQLTDVFCALTIGIYTIGLAIFDYKKWLILFTVIPLSGVYCITIKINWIKQLQEKAILVRKA